MSTATSIPLQFLEDLTAKNVTQHVIDIFTENAPDELLKMLVSVQGERDSNSIQ
jgi:hypothetical protein